MTSGKVYGALQFPARNGVKATKLVSATDRYQCGSQSGGSQAQSQYANASHGEAIMKPLLHLKTLVLLLYVALCTHLVLSALEGENPAATGPLPHIMHE